MLDSRLSGVKRVTEDFCGSCHSVEGEPKFQGMKVDLEGLCCLNVIWLLGDYNEVISISAGFDVWSLGLW